jgi:hypothetical protein
MDGMNESTLFGWTFAQWRALAKWAGKPFSLSKVFSAAVQGQFATPAEQEALADLLDLRERWLEAGGPMSGPSGTIILESA